MSHHKKTTHCKMSIKETCGRHQNLSIRALGGAKIVTHRTLVFVDFLEALVEREVVSYRVLPARWGVRKVGEMCDHPVVNVLHRQSLRGAVLDRHEDEAAERVWRFAETDTRGQHITLISNRVRDDGRFVAIFSCFLLY